MSTMRIGGLASGMDIDSLVEKLMQAERAPLDKLEQKKQTYEWQRDAYRDVNTKLQTLDTYIADNLILKSIISKTATSTNSDLVSAVATSSASGTLSIEGVSQLAVAARAVGGQVNLVNSSKISDLAGTGFIELKAIQSNGEMPAKATKIEITSDMTVDQFVSKVNSSGAGVSMVFENGRFSMTAKNTGDNKAGDEIQIVNGHEIFESLGFVKDEEGSYQTTDGKNAIFKVNGIATERSTNSFTISGYSVTLKDTFNSTQTIAEKYTAAAKEKELAQANKATKEDELTDAILAYYGSTTPISKPSYTTDHNKAYIEAFGNTLTLTEQESYNKLGSTFWKRLSVQEISFIDQLTSDQDATQIRNAINDSGLDDSSKKKLNGLTDAQLVELSNLSQTEVGKFNEQANYATYGTNINLLNDDVKNAIKSFTYNSEDELTTLHQNIDTNLDVSDDVKKFLKSLAKDDLTDLVNLVQTDSPTLSTYQAKATADELKTKYNALGDSLIMDLTAGTKNVSDLTTSQQDVWNSLNADQKSQFNTLAEQNQLRNNYKNAEAELKAAETRLTNANNTFTTARTDAQEARLLTVDENGDEVIDQTKVDSATEANPVTMTSTTNVDDIITKIKEFVNTYNGLIKDLNNLTKESKYRDYQPLTSAQRKEMEEKEIELWEEKAKSGLLRGDSIIQNGLSSMRSLIYESNPAVTNTKFNTLFSIGITTSKNYLEGGTLEIDENKLRAALEEDPDAVATLFSNSSGKKAEIVNGVEVAPDTRGYLQKLRASFDDIQVRIESRAGRSTMTQTQYTLGKYLKDVDDQIDKWQDKLVSIENRYWTQFGAMESMINKANSQSSMLMGQYF